MPADLPGLLTDLAAETDDLVSLLAPLDEQGWRTPTPAAGWDVKDQVSHLAFFDETATLSAVDPDAFVRAAEDLVDRGEDFTEHVARLHHQDLGTELLAWFTDARRTLLSTFAALDAGTKLPWYGPPMSAASSVTARLMETWAHGQDVADALGVVRQPTHRLRHVAHLGVSTVGWSFRLRGLEPPAAPVRVELDAPDGSAWTWGAEDAAEQITGPAEDFCLLVTQRRHRDDLRVRATGPTMAGYLEVAQAFAGPPGPGRAPMGGGTA